MMDFKRYMITGAKRKETLRYMKETYANRALYAVTNSTLDLEGSRYGYSFYYYFAPVIEEASSLREYIEKVLENKKGKAIGCEFGGEGYFFKEFSSGFFAQSLAVSLYPFRYNLLGKLSKTMAGYLRKPKVVKKLNEINHSVIRGNLLNEEVYLFVNRQLSGRKVDFILQRMVLGLDHIPLNPFIIFSIFQTWYEMLNEEGLMLVEIPVCFEELCLLDSWTKLLEDLKQQGVIDYKIGSLTRFNKVLRLIKKRGAPERLPFLTTKQVAECFRKSDDILCNLLKGS